MNNNIEWVTVPYGQVWIGTDLSVDQVAADFAWARQVEIPQHQIELSEFCISRYPVTNSQWEPFLTQTGYDWVDRDKLWKSGLPLGKEHHPVAWVTWQDALAFCRWAGVRLPTEVEWEKAARGVDRRLYPWGNQPPTSNQANFDKQVGDTTPVDHYPSGKSIYNVYDLAGNVWEWTSTAWGTDKNNPEFVYPYCINDGRENLDNPDILRVVRAGGWKYSADMIRCAYRDWNDPHVRGSALGFRVVK